MLIGDLLSRSGLVSAFLLIPLPAATTFHTASVVVCIKRTHYLVVSRYKHAVKYSLPFKKKKKKKDGKCTSVM